MLQDLRATLVQNHVRVIDLFRDWDEDESGRIDRTEFRRGLLALGIKARSWAVHAVSWRGDGVERANTSVWLAPTFFGSNLSVTAWQPGGGGAVVARLSPAGGAGEYCCVPPPLRSRIGRYSEWLLLDVKG